MSLDMYLIGMHPMSLGTTVQILTPVNERLHMIMYLIDVI